MKKFTKSIIFSTTLVMAATSQAQQMEEHEHKGVLGIFPSKKT